MDRKNKRDEASTKVAADASKALTNLVREHCVEAGIVEAGMNEPQRGME